MFGVVHSVQFHTPASGAFNPAAAQLKPPLDTEDAGGETAGVEAFVNPAGRGSSHVMHLVALAGLFSEQRVHVHSPSFDAGIGFIPAAAQSKLPIKPDGGEAREGGVIGALGVVVPEPA